MSWFKPHYLPMLLIIIDVLAAIVYAAHGDIRENNILVRCGCAHGDRNFLIRIRMKPYYETKNGKL